MLINEHSRLGYQFIAMNEESDRVVSIDDELIDISTYFADEIQMIHADYIPTSRFIEFPFDAMDKLAALCIISPHSLLFPKQNTHNCSPQMSLEEDFAQHGLTNNF